MRPQPAENAHTVRSARPKDEITTFDFAAPKLLRGNDRRGGVERRSSSRSGRSAPTFLNLQPFSMLLPNERFAALPDELKVEYFALLRDQHRALMRLCREKGIAGEDIAAAVWGR